MKKYDVIIVGGGAAGLACAVALSENPNLKILIIEAGERVGKKLSATGNGQGNIFNCDMNIHHYRSGNLGLVEKIVYCDDDRPVEWACNRIFGTMLYKGGTMGRVYPQSLQASSLTDILLRRLQKRGVSILLSKRVINIERGFTVDCGEKFTANFVVLATGGKAQKQFGTDGSAYKLAQTFGHKITPLYPSIVQLKTDTTHIKNLKGIRALCFVQSFVNGERKHGVLGDVIFTDYGVSGNAIFYVSSVLTKQGGMISLDFLPDFSAKTVEDTLLKRRKDGIETSNLLCGILHNQLARAILKRAASDDIKNIVDIIKNFTLEVTGTLGFDYAQVTQGGVDMRDISDNLESKLCKNLYFAGEILDVDGDCGGYNLHWAFTSAQTVANAIIVENNLN